VAGAANERNPFIKRGSKKPWRAYQNYLKDIATLKWAPVANPVLKFSNPAKPTPRPATPELVSAAKYRLAGC